MELWYVGAMRVLCCCLMLSLPWVAAATTPVAQYPIQGKLPESTLRSASDLILGGVQLSQGRGGFEPASPYLLPASCAPVTGACLAALAGGAHVLYADAKSLPGEQVAVTVWLVFPEGRKSRPVRFEFNPALQDARAGYQAIALLEQALIGGSAALAEGTPAQPAETVTPPLAISEAVPVPAAPGPAQAGGTQWMGTAGSICAYGGLAVFAGGAVFGLLGRGLNEELTQRYQSGQLRPEDGARFARLRTFNLLANSLMIGGAVAGVAGVTLWTLAPSVTPTEGGAYLSVGGRF